MKVVLELDDESVRRVSEISRALNVDIEKAAILSLILALVSLGDHRPGG
ncbi:MAG: hypothetical protein QXR62_06215 [Candidatus Bathyarchaeia archaeon]